MYTCKIGDLEITIVGICYNNFGGRLDRAGTNALVHTGMEAGIT